MREVFGVCARMVSVAGFLLLRCAGVLAYDVVEVKNGGEITGEVKFRGTPPVPEKVTVSKDEEVCGKTEKINESLVVGPNRGIQNVVIAIVNLQRGKAFAETAVTLDQKDCRYEPHVVLVPAGKELTILNSDGILHNVHTYSSKNPAFNKAQPRFKKELKETFAQPETVKLTCDAHPWMSGWLIVQEQPYYGVSDASGAFRLTDVPPGDYEVRFWHEVLGEISRHVVVEPAAEVRVEVEMGK